MLVFMCKEVMHEVSENKKWQKFLENFLPSLASGLIVALVERLLDR